MSKFELPRDLGGDLIPLGSVKKTLEAPFLLSTSMPNWLSNTSQSGNNVVVVQPTSSPGFIKLNSNGGVAQVKLTTPLSIGHFSALRWDLEGTYFDHATDPLSLYVGFCGTNVGAYVQFDAPTKVKYCGSGYPVDVNHYATNQYQKRQNLSALLLTRRKKMYVLENDQVMACVDLPDLVNTGSITPDIAYKSAPSTNSSVYIYQLRLTLWTNG